MNNLLEIKNLSKDYYSLKETTKAIENISFDVKEGQYISIVGTSGCGKSTLLNIIAGLDFQTGGEIVKNKDLTIGYMFQDHALLPYLTVFQNAILGLKLKKTDTKENILYVEKLLNTYGLSEFKNKYPTELSGGMMQRLALIRTLATKPDLLLLDEPFSALDYQSRLLVSKDVYNIIKKENKTVIMITHDISEAASLSSKVIVLSKRPATIKQIIDISYEENDPIKRRHTKAFANYYDMIWRLLDEKI